MRVMIEGLENVISFVSTPHVSSALPSVSSTVLYRLATLLSSIEGPESKCGRDGGDDDPSGAILLAKTLSPYSSSGRLNG